MKKIILITTSIILLSFVLAGTAFANGTTPPADGYSSGAACKSDAECTISGEQCVEGNCFKPMDLLLFKAGKADWINPDEKKDLEIKALGKLPEVSMYDLFKTVLKTILGAAMIITIIAIVVAAVYYITSQGQEEDITKAKNIILYLIIGMVIMAAAYGLVSGVVQFDFFKTK